MANTIRLKKRASGGASGAPSSLAPSEPAYSEVDNILYYGFGDAGGGQASSVISIAGSGAFTTLGTSQTITGDKTFTGTCDFSGATLSGNTTFSNNLTVSGDLTVSGTTTTVNSTQLDVADKNITLGNVSTPTDTTADGGGITLKGATDKVFLYINNHTSWFSSENINIGSNKTFRVNNVETLSATALGSAVVSSSLTSVGTIATGTWQGTTIGRAYGGTGLTAAPSNGQLLIGNGTGYALSTLTAGSNVTITNSAGGIEIAASGGAPTAGDGIDVDGSEVSVDIKANSGLIIDNTELSLDADLVSLASCQTGSAAALALLTSTEVGILDGATVTTAELNVMDGGTSATSTTLATADRMVMNDAGTMKQVALSDLVTFLEDGATSGFDIDGGTF